MISLTEDALVNIRRLQLENQALGWGLRFGLTGGGCSGYRYVLEFEDNAGSEDRVFTFGDVQVFVSSDHLKKLSGSTIGWKALKNTLYDNFMCSCKGQGVVLEINLERILS